ncbi:hypothetical protein ACGF12_22805 [Kitasatospora sp. NPDC048296]|uniref:hypothetical protein n=1 Tax=Kitasatospora sp. NPDC048296 TaxID=3364048 RepID=UPI00371B2196
MAIDAPDADGPLSADEEERWDLCRQSFRQAKDAWFVAGRAMDIALRGRLWRADYATAALCIEGEMGMSTSNAYRQMGGSEVAAILASPPRLELEAGLSTADASIEQESNDLSRTRDNGTAHQASPTAATADGSPTLDTEPQHYGTGGTPGVEQESNDLSRTRANGTAHPALGAEPASADASQAPTSAAPAEEPAIEQESNDLSRTRDNGNPGAKPTGRQEPAAQAEPTIISQRAAEALNPIREDYGAAVAAEAYRTISKATGTQVLTGKAISGVMRELPRKKAEALTPEQLHERIKSVVAKQKAAKDNPLQDLAQYVAAASKFSRQMEGLAEAHRKAAKHDPEAAEQLMSQLRTHLSEAADGLPVG